MDNRGFVTGARKLGKSRSQVQVSPGNTGGTSAGKGRMPGAALRLASVAAGILPAGATVR